jgi:hypothetical protein
LERFLATLSNTDDVSLLIKQTTHENSNQKADGSLWRYGRATIFRLQEGELIFV